MRSVLTLSLIVETDDDDDPKDLAERALSHVEQLIGESVVVDSAYTVDDE